MKIAESSVALSASHALLEQRQRSESLHVWVGDEANPRATLTEESNGTQTKASLSVARQQTLQATATAAPVETAKPAKRAPKTMGDLETSLVQAIVERFTGRKIHVVHAEDLQSRDSSNGEPAASEGPQSADGNNQGQGWGAVYQATETRHEAETTRFTAGGTIKTADGKEIEFTAELNMSREFVSRQQLNVRAGDALTDPLVINFGGTAAQLTQTKFAFDLNADGQSDRISFVTPGSGFLALDKNGNGKVDNGSELFGPTAGSGFSELSQYDQDHNNWIDENDAVFNQLRIWSKDSAGNDRLSTLAQQGVGAIYLGSTATPFSIKDSGNNLQGAVQSTGVYLNENGSGGTVQQVDLVV